MTSKAETFVPFRLRRGRGRLLDALVQGHDPVLLEALGRALHWQSLLDEGVVASNADIAEREGLERSTVTRLLPLALLAPAIIEQCLAGQQPRTLTLRWLQRHRLPDDWVAQYQVINQFD